MPAGHENVVAIATEIPNGICRGKGLLTMSFRRLDILY